MSRCVHCGETAVEPVLWPPGCADVYCASCALEAELCYEELKESGILGNMVAHEGPGRDSP